MTETKIEPAVYIRGNSFIEAAKLIINNNTLDLELNIDKNSIIEEIEKIEKQWKENKDNESIIKDKEYLASLQKELINIISNNIYAGQKSFKSVKDELDNAENHINWVEREQKSSALGDEITTLDRLETPVVRLTNQQKQEWETILTEPENPPKWFKDLANWEQNYLKREILPKIIADEPIMVPSTIRRYPGAPNAYVTEVTATDGNQSFSFRKFRSGVLTPPKIKDKQEQQRIAVQNMEQMLVAAMKDYLQQNPSYPTKTDLPVINILFQTLYSPPVQPGGAAAGVQRLAYKEMQQKYSDKNNLHKLLADSGVIDQGTEKDPGTHKIPGVMIINSNRPVNIIRGLSWLHSRFSGQGSDNKKATDFISNSINEKIRIHTVNGPGGSIDPNLQMAREAMQTFKSRSYIQETLIPLSANPMVERAALEQIAASAVGVRVGSCVSGKDREEMVTMVAAAMVQFYASHGEFPPQYNVKNSDDLAKRQEFCNMVAEQYLSGYGQELAGLNSKGCDGLKNVTDVLSPDIRKAIIVKNNSENQQTIYKGCDPIKDVQKIAGLNKLNVDLIKNAPDFSSYSQKQVIQVDVTSGVKDSTKGQNIISSKLANSLSTLEGSNKDFNSKNNKIKKTFISIGNIKANQHEKTPNSPSPPPRPKNQAPTVK